MSQVADVITPDHATTRLGGVADELLKLAGGRQGVAKRLWRGLCKAEGVDPDNPDQELRDGDVSAHRALNYHSILVRLISAADKGALEQQRLDLSMQDLEGIAVQTALEWVQTRPQFRELMLKTLLNADPTIATQLVEMQQKLIEAQP